MAERYFSGGSGGTNYPFNNPAYWSTTFPVSRTGSRSGTTVTVTAGSGGTAGLSAGMTVVAYLSGAWAGLGTIVSVLSATTLQVSLSGTVTSRQLVFGTPGGATTATDDLIVPNLFGTAISIGWSSSTSFALDISCRDFVNDSTLELATSSTLTGAIVRVHGRIYSRGGGPIRLGVAGSYPTIVLANGGILDVSLAYMATNITIDAGNSGTATINYGFNFANPRAVSHTSGTFNLNADIGNAASYISTNTNTRVTNGTGNITINHTAIATIISASNLTNYTWNCSGYIINNNASFARTILLGNTGLAIRGPNLRLQGTASVTFTGLIVSCADFDYQAETQFATGVTINCCSWSYSSTATVPSNLVLNFVGPGNWNSNRILSNISINHTGTTTLQTNISRTGLVLTLTRGRLALNGYSLFMKQLSSSNTNERGIDWGSTSATIDIGNDAASSYAALAVQIADNFTNTNKGTFVSSNTLTKSYTFGNTSNNATLADYPNVSITTAQGAATTTTCIGFFEKLNLSGVDSVGTSNITANQITYSSINSGASSSLTLVGNNPIFNPIISNRTIGTININCTGTVSASNTLRANTFNHINGNITLATGNIEFSANNVGKFGNGTITGAANILGRGIEICNGGTCTINGGTLGPNPIAPTFPQYVKINNSGGFGVTNFVYVSGNWSLVPYIEQSSGSVTLNNNLTILSTGYYDLANGSLDLGTNTLAVQDFNSTGSATTRSITGTGTISVSGNWTVTSGTNFTGDTYTINMTKATSKTFAGAGGGYGKLNQAGAGDLTISGSNFFSDMTATVVPSTITFTAGSAQSLQAFNVNGTSGNLVTLVSTTPGTQYTLSKTTGTVSVSWLQITDSNVGGGATWTASNTTFVSNNTGWGSGPVYAINGQFFQFFS